MSADPDEGSFSMRKLRKKRAKPIVPIDVKSLGPKMRALPNDAWRAAAVARFMVKRGRGGGNTGAARAAGYDGVNLKRVAFRIFHDQRMLEALHELGEQHLKHGVPDAIATVFEIMDDKRHKDRLKAAQVFIDRAHPVSTLHHVTVEHKIDYTKQALEELATFRRLGVAREKLEQLYGRDGLYHLEQQLDASPKVIEGTAEDIS
jgi:hypothetical protein